jgi:hypothetical protein
LIDAWRAFEAERRITFCPTSLVGDYRQVGRWLAPCPIQDLE